MKWLKWVFGIKSKPRIMECMGDSGNWMLHLETEYTDYKHCHCNEATKEQTKRYWAEVKRSGRW